MTFQQELASWNPFAYSSQPVQSVPSIDDTAPSTPQLRFPRSDRKPTIVAFLRHCGCPFAEKLFRTLRQAAGENSSIHFIAISHSDENATHKWVNDVGGAGDMEVIVDHERQIYGAYGLGLSSIWHALNPWSMSSVMKLGKSEQIWNRPTESGSRWQTAGLFAVDGEGKIKYVHVAQAADDLGSLTEAEGAVKH